MSEAISNADAARELAHVAAEQAALGRVAMRVASETGLEQLLGSAANEVNELFGPEIAAVITFERDETFVTLEAAGGLRSTGSRAELDPTVAVAAVLETRRAARPSRAP